MKNIAVISLLFVACISQSFAQNSENDSELQVLEKRHYDLELTLNFLDYLASQMAQGTKVISFNEFEYKFKKSLLESEESQRLEYWNILKERIVYSHQVQLQQDATDGKDFFVCFKDIYYKKGIRTYQLDVKDQTLKLVPNKK